MSFRSHIRQSSNQSMSREVEEEKRTAAKDPKDVFKNVPKDKRDGKSLTWSPE